MRVGESAGLITASVSKAFAAAECTLSTDEVLPEHGDHAQAGGLQRGPPGRQRQVRPKVPVV